jgi:hypothetical protein
MSMKLLIAIGSRIAFRRLTRIVAAAIIGIVWFSQLYAQAIEGEDTFQWTTFTSRGGWSVRYPPNLHVSSCRQCEDATDPDVMVAFSRSSGEVLVMIEPLADKRPARNTRQWLSEVAHETVLSPVVSEQWTFIDGALALTVTNGASASDKTDNIYIVHGVKTFAIHFPHIADAGVRAICEQILSTFRFSSH